MSYLRGDYYAWSGCSGGADHGYDEYGPTCCSITLHGNPTHCGCNEHKKHPSISIPVGVFDALVVMRYAEMTEAEKIRAVVYAIDHGRGNGGCSDLVKQVGANESHEEEEKWKQQLSLRYTLKEKPLPARKHHRKHHAARKR